MNSDRSVLTSLRSSLYTGIIFLFFEYIFAKFVISAPGWSLSIVFCLNAIDDDLAVNAGCRHPRGPSLVFSSGFSFSYLLIPLPVRRVVRGPAPRYNERRTFWFRFILAAQLPATASDGLYSSTSPLFSLRFFCLLLSSTQICFFFTELLQRRDLYDIFASARQGPFCPFTFQYFFSRNDVFNQRFRGAEGESSPQSPPAGAFLS